MVNSKLNFIGKVITVTPSAKADINEQKFCEHAAAWVQEERFGPGTENLCKYR